MQGGMLGGVERRREGFLHSSIEVVSVWCQAAQGGVPLAQALRRMADIFLADIAAVARVDHASPARTGAGGAHARVVAFDRRANFVDEVAGFRVSYAEAVCGHYVNAAKPGTIWQARTADFDHDPRLHAPLRHRRLVETVVIALEHHATCSDFLELHFAEQISAGFGDNLAQICPVLADAWKNRAMGILSQNMMAVNRTGPERTRTTDAPVLSVDNPYRLSRAEYRVCLLLSNGLNKNAVLEELSIGLSTLRTHLRNIYAKTGTASQAELLQRLLVRPAPAEQAGAKHVA